MKKTSFLLLLLTACAQDKTTLGSITNASDVQAAEAQASDASGPVSVASAESDAAAIGFGTKTAADFGFTK